MEFRAEQVLELSMSGDEIGIFVSAIRKIDKKANAVGFKKFLNQDEKNMVNAICENLIVENEEDNDTD